MCNVGAPSISNECKPMLAGALSADAAVAETEQGREMPRGTDEQQIGNFDVI